MLTCFGTFETSTSTLSTFYLALFVFSTGFLSTNSKEGWSYLALFGLSAPKSAYLKLFLILLVYKRPLDSYAYPDQSRGKRAKLTSILKSKKIKPHAIFWEKAQLVLTVV